MEDDEIVKDLMDDVEARAKELAESYTHMVGTISTGTHADAMILTQYANLFTEATDDLRTVIDSAVGNTQALISRCNELNEELKQVYHLGHEAAQITHLLDMLEMKMDHVL